MEKWCCDWFQDMILSYGKKGFAIVAFHDESCDYRAFFLSSMPFDERVRKALTDESLAWPVITDRGSRVPLAISVENRIPVDYCPRCGKSMKSLIKKYNNQFDSLAMEQSKIENILWSS